MNVTAGSISSFHNLFEPIGIGFGTAGLGKGSSTYFAITEAFHNGFRKFDTAEESDYWYDPQTVGTTLESLIDLEWMNANTDTNTDTDTNKIKKKDENNDEKDTCNQSNQNNPCWKERLQVSTKIPPWELTTAANIRSRAKASRDQLVGFCPDLHNGSGLSIPYPLDIYYIHAPSCWDNWHTRCHGIGDDDTMSLKEVWRAMEEIVFVDKVALRIGLSNVNEYELLDLIHDVENRMRLYEKEHTSNIRRHNAHYYTPTPPRMPDVLQSYADPLHPATKLRAICKQYNIEFVAYSTLGTQHEMTYTQSKNPVLSHPNVQLLANRYNRSTAEVVLSWAMSKGMSVIPRSGKKHHIQQLSKMLDEENRQFLNHNDLQLIDGMALN